MSSGQGRQQPGGPSTSGFWGALAAVGIALSLAAPASAHEPIEGVKSTFGEDPVTFHTVNSPASWFITAEDAALEVNFHSASSNNTRIPTLSRVSGGSGIVEYKDLGTSPCGSNNPDWLQCALWPSHDEFWRIYVRDLTSSGPSGWTWYEAASSCAGSPTCFYMKRALIHEAGHAMFGFPDMCIEGRTPCRLEAETVMNGQDPEVGVPGSLNWTYQKCDHAGAQLDWGYGDKAGVLGNCLDHLADSGPSGLRTNMEVNGSAFVGCNGLPLVLSGRLDIRDYASYGKLGDEELWDRTVWFDRGSTLHYASTVTNHGATTNWTKSFSGSNVTYTFKAYFTDVIGDALDPSDIETFSVTFGSAC